MSYRDIRNFTEMMRALGYSRLISMENFRSPNFTLVAEILIWLVHRFEPDVDVHTDYDSEADRVMLIRSIAQFMATKANIKLNTKFLYQADGYAVREMLKATTVLYDALKVNVTSLGEENGDSSPSVDLSYKIYELKRARQLASEITSEGAILFDLLGKEVEMREIRNARLNRQLELVEVESTLKQAMEKLRNEISNIKLQMENVSASEASLDSKIEKKQVELERNQKRLQTLKKVRPAFLEEFERLEDDLRQLYQVYIVRFRCLAYLEQQQEEAERAEQDRMQERQAATKKLLEQLKHEEKLLEGSGDPFGMGDIVKEDIDDVGRLPGKASRMRIQTASRVMRKASAGVQQRRVFGSMNGPNDDEDDSLDSDSDLLLDGDGSELLGTDEEDEEEDIELGADGLSMVSSQRPKQTDQHSDDDF